MIAKCVEFSSSDGYERRIIFKSGFKGMYVIFYETGTYDTEFEYMDKKDLLKEFSEYESEINQL